MEFQYSLKFQVLTDVWRTFLTEKAVPDLKFRYDLPGSLRIGLAYWFKFIQVTED